MLKKKTYTRLIKTIEESVPLKKIKAIYGEDRVKTIKKLILEYCIYAISVKITNRKSCVDFLSGKLKLEESISIIPTYSRKDGIHFIISYVNLHLDWAYEYYLEKREDNQKRRREQKYAARQYKIKK